MAENKTKRLEIRLPAEADKELRRYCRRKKITMTKAITKMIIGTCWKCHEPVLPRAFEEGRR